MRRMIVAFAVLALLAAPAYAQGTDVRPFLSQIIDVLAMVLMGAGSVLIGFLLRWLKSKTNMQDNEFEALMASRLNDILHRSIEHAVVVAKNEVAKPGSGLESVKFDNFFLNIATNLAMKSMPDIIDYFKLSKERIEEMIISRMGGYLGEVAVGGAAASAQKSAEDARPSQALVATG